MDFNKKVMLYSKENIDELAWPDNPNGKYAQNYILPMIRNGVRQYISNLDTEIMVIKIDDVVLPITVNESEYENSYVCSTYTHYITYSMEELEKLKNRPLEVLIKLFLNFIGFFMKLCKINKVVCVNNWMLSTNLYPNLTHEQLEKINSFLLGKFSDHAIIFRSVNRLTTKDILNFFESSKFLLIGSRSSYVYFSEDIHSKNERHIIKRDKKLKEKSEYLWKDSEEEQLTNVARLKELYDQLYLDKYSKCNPQFTEEYIKLCIKENLLSIYSLSNKNRIDGTIGFFERNGIIATPFFGYDLSVAQKEGLYRMLSLRLFEEAVCQNNILHLSSGAGEFKKCRGAKNVIEYSAVYIRHLSFFRKVIWLVLDKIVNCFAMPIIVKKKL